MKQYNQLISGAIILLAISNVLMSTSNLYRSHEIKELQKQINEIKFEREYGNYSIEDGEKQ